MEEESGRGWKPASWQKSEPLDANSVALAHRLSRGPQADMDWRGGRERREGRTLSVDKEEGAHSLQYSVTAVRGVT